MNKQENAFQRWMRVKQASKAPNHAAPELAASSPIQAPSPAVVPFETAGLPSIEAIAADVSAFLKAGVPAELTWAALRRTWAIDPAIRDFIGIAENQWDFNTANAIPGFGPLTPLESGQGTISYSIASSLEYPEALPDHSDSFANPSWSGSDQPIHHAKTDIATPSIAQTPSASETIRVAANKLPVEFAAAHRRHGGALPS